MAIPQNKTAVIHSSNVYGFNIPINILTQFAIHDDWADAKEIHQFFQAEKYDATKQHLLTSFSQSVNQYITNLNTAKYETIGFQLTLNSTKINESNLTMFDKRNMNEFNCESNSSYGIKQINRELDSFFKDINTDWCLDNHEEFEKYGKPVTLSSVSITISDAQPKA